MGTVLDLWRREPAVIIAVITAALNLLAGFGLPISGEQKALVMAFLTALSGVIIRTQVSPAKTNT